jgi:hypothetical protein
MSDKQNEWILARIDEGIVFEAGLTFSVELWPDPSGDGPAQLHIDRYVQQDGWLFDVQSVAEAKARFTDARAATL